MKLPVTIKDQTIEVDIPEENLIAAGWKKPVSKGRWKPQQGVKYFFISGGIGYNYYANDDADNRIISSCIVYKTREEVEKALERQKAIIRVNDRIDELNDGWEPEWGRDATIGQKWCIEKDLAVRAPHFSVNWDRLSFCPMALNYCKSEEVAEQVIEECEADLKVIFEV